MKTGMMNYLYVPAVVVMMLLVGCAGSRPVPKPVDDGEPYRLESEGEVALDNAAVRLEVDRVVELEETPVTSGDIPVEDVEYEPVETAEPPDSLLPSMGGFRVQVFASGSYDAAEEVRQAAVSTLGVASYVDRIDGVYKVRVGDCPSRLEAEDLLLRCRQAGYSDAWIVASQVFYKRPQG